MPLVCKEFSLQIWNHKVDDLGYHLDTYKLFVEHTVPVHLDPDTIRLLPVMISGYNQFAKVTTSRQSCHWLGKSSLKHMNLLTLIIN